MRTPLGNSDSSIAYLGNLAPKSGYVHGTQVNYELSIDDSSSLSIKLYHRKLQSLGDTIEFSTPIVPNPIGRHEIESNKHGLRSTMRTEISTGHVLWGVDYDYHDYQQPNSAVGFEPITPAIQQDSYAGFVQLETDLTTDFHVSLGLRYELVTQTLDDYVIANLNRYSNAGNTVAGGSLSFDAYLFNIGAVYDLTDTQNAFLSYSQGFTMGESLRVLRNTSSLTVENALDVEPKVVDNFELGYRWTTLDLSFTTSAFYSESRLGSTLSQSTAQGIQLAREPESVWGGEAEVRGHIGGPWIVSGNLSWYEGEHDTATGTEPLNGHRISPLKLAGSIGYIQSEELSFFLYGVFSGHRRKFGSGGTGFGEGDVSSIYLIDAALSYDVGPGTLTLGINNLLNKQYIPQVVQARNRSGGYFAGAGTIVEVAYSFDF